MEELYKVMDDLLEVEFQMKAGMDILKELESTFQVRQIQRVLYTMHRIIPIV